MTTTRRFSLWVCAVSLLITALLLPLPTMGQDTVSDVIANAVEAWTGDFDEMVERRIIRVLVVYSKTFYFIDKAEQRGISYDVLKEFEKTINEDLKLKTLRVKVVFLPVARDELFPLLAEGYGDIAVANLTITPERQKLVDFSEPVYTGVDEIVITGPSGPALSSLDDLAGQEIYLRTSSSYYEHALILNEAFKQAGKPPMKLIPVDENLEDEDLLEMVNAGLLPMVIVDSHKAQFWDQVFDNITLYPEIAVNTGGEIAWAFRKSSPQLQQVVNAFVKDHKKGTLMGNMILKRYLRSTKYVKNALNMEERNKFEAMVVYFKQYAEEYGFDYLMVAAQGYQESRLDQGVRSSAGAVGVMQLLPSTAADSAVGIPNIEELEPNIHAGIKYMHYIYDRYFKDAEMALIDKGLFSFASYNAGPAKVAKLRTQAAERGLNPNVWFHNVDLVAAEVIGRETVQYVSNIFKYYIAYKLLIDQAEKKRAALPEDLQEKRGDEIADQATTAPAGGTRTPSHQAIRTIQERLTELGYQPGPIDGMWGKSTEAALKHFQQDQGVSVTGTVDENTAKKLGL
ncbi:MAG: transporter substrate-binding domain-containing protein [bacterium]|nr:transporter substrate-binding domain-containing protein [bacterium]